MEAGVDKKKEDEMKIRAMIGTTERHEIEAETDFLGKKKVMVDGDDIIDKREILSFSDTVRLTVGEEERHELRVKFSRGISGQKIEIYADGRLLAKT
jgi:hypothetical protein